MSLTASVKVNCVLIAYKITVSSNKFILILQRFDPNFDFLFPNYKNSLTNLFPNKFVMCYLPAQKKLE